MSKNWAKSNLCIGETVRVPKDLFIEPDKSQARIQTVTYLGETSSGLLFEFEFLPSFGIPKNCKYRRMISWASIWCGHVQIRRTNGEIVRARRAKGQPIVEGQYRGQEEETWDI